jgi:hypothetical protein
MEITVRNNDVKGIERTLSDREASTIANALRVARDRYKQDAVQCRLARDEEKAEQNAPAWAGAAYERLAKQFDQQAKDCDALFQSIDFDF